MFKTEVGDKDMLSMKEKFFKILPHKKVYDRIGLQSLAALEWAEESPGYKTLR